MLRTLLLTSALLIACGSHRTLAGQDKQPPKPAEAAPPADLPERPLADDKADRLVPLNKDQTVLLDRAGKRVVLKAMVACRQGALEMLLCKSQTKEHESILAIDAQAYVIHTGLLALGAKSGTPVKFFRAKPGTNPVEFVEDYQPPTGQKIDIFVQWHDEQGRLHRRNAQEWIRHATRRFYGEPLEVLPEVALPEDTELRYHKDVKELSWYGIMSEDQRDDLLALSDDKPFRKAIESFYKRSQVRGMQAEWVFAGSSFHVDDDGKRYYQAEGGDVICVANFSSAMIDVAAESTSSGEDNLLFEAWTERIPPMETAVTVELIPVFEKEGRAEQPRKRE